MTRGARSVLQIRFCFFLVCDTLYSIVPIASWKSDWKQTGIGPRIVLGLVAAFLLYWGVSVMVDAVHPTRPDWWPIAEKTDWGEVAELESFIAYLFVSTVLWPYWMACAVRRRGGKFNLWLGIGMIFTIPSVLMYFGQWAFKPKLFEYENEQITTHTLNEG